MYIIFIFNVYLFQGLYVRGIMESSSSYLLMESLTAIKSRQAPTLPCSLQKKTKNQFSLESGIYFSAKKQWCFVASHHLIMPIFFSLLCPLKMSPYLQQIVLLNCLFYLPCLWKQYRTFYWHCKIYFARLNSYLPVSFVLDQQVFWKSPALSVSFCKVIFRLSKSL